MLKDKIINFNKNKFCWFFLIIFFFQNWLDKFYHWAIHNKGLEFSSVILIWFSNNIFFINVSVGQFFSVGGLSCWQIVCWRIVIWRIVVWRIVLLAGLSCWRIVGIRWTVTQIIYYIVRNTLFLVLKVLRLHWSL